MTRALYPGTFDPIHNGHVDIVTRACAIFDEVVLAIYDAPPKNLLFATDERVRLAQQSIGHLPNVSVVSYTGLTVNCAIQMQARVIVRGLRNVSDFEFEHQIGWANKQMAPNVELCCLFCNGDYASLSATILKEVASLGGDYHDWAPAHVRQALQRKYPPNGDPVSATVISRSDGKLSHHS
jgi:pantetheine-phosphate adenylyltransferase